MSSTNARDVRYLPHAAGRPQWQIAILPGTLTLRPSVQVGTDGRLRIGDVKVEGGEQRGLRILEDLQPGQPGQTLKQFVLSPQEALGLLEYLRDHEAELRQMADAEVAALEHLRRGVEGALDVLP